jgi:dTDP-4-amino-4,6-dideoxygalactose transaminase
MTTLAKRRSLPSKLAIDGGSPVRESMLLFGAPALGESEYNEVLDTLKSGWIGTGPKTIRFEEEFAAYVGARRAIAVNSCTAALHLSLVVCGIGEGDEVITTPLTFAATANVIVHQRARPIFADIDPNTLNIDPREVQEAITPRTKAILPVHFGGLACPMDELNAIADSNGLRIIEDAAHAVATRYKGKMIGNLGNLTCFSFYANKNLTTAEGGMITTEDDSEADYLEIYRLHGLSRDAWKRYRSRQLMLSDAIYPGYKYNLTDIQASLGIHQLRRQEEFIAIRERYAQMYDAAFADLPGIRRQPRPVDPDNRHALHLYVLILDPEQYLVDRNQIVAALLAENIGAAIHYRALHTHPYYRDRFGFHTADYPHAASIGNNIFTLPLSPGMSESDLFTVVEAVKKVLRVYRR